MTLDLDALPHGQEIFEALRLGKHLDEGDFKFFHALTEHFDHFHALFGYLGFELVQHERRFFYFRGTGDSATLGKRTRQMSVFFFVFIDTLSTRGEPVIDTLFRADGHRIEQLPHFDRAQHRDCLSEVNIRTDDDLEELVSRLERYNFVEGIGPGEFRLREPAWRFVELCYAYVDQASDESTAEETTI